jgi:serine/threonine-protein kinase
MRVSIEEFVRQIVKVGLMSATEAADYQATFPPEKRPADAKALAVALIHDRRLTCCQAELILGGKANLIVLGDYVVQKRIGKGGMGEVFQAYHRRMARAAAIKVLNHEGHVSDASKRRFLQEARAAGRLCHPNIVTTYDAGEQHGVQYLVMEYVEGIDLATRLRKHGPMTAPQAVQCVLQAAYALEYAHHRNVLHRDVKPSNLLLDRQGTIKILDMGLARIAEVQSEPGATLPERLTRTGEMLGTVDYVSPEQAEDARQADQRSDVYSLGCTMFTLMTGCPVYEGSTSTAKLLAHRESPVPSLRVVVPGTSEPLDRAFGRMIAKRQADRQQSMSDVIRELTACPEAQKATDLLSTGPLPGTSGAGRVPSAATVTRTDRPDRCSKSPGPMLTARGGSTACEADLDDATRDDPPATTGSTPT